MLQRFHSSVPFTVILRRTAPLLVPLLLAVLAACSKSPVRPPPPGSIPQSSDLDPQWSPTGARIAFLHVAGSDTSRPTGLFVVDTLAGSSALVFGGIPNGFDWTPGSDTLIVSFAGTLLAVALGGSTTSLAVHEAYNCRVSPDGHTVAFDAAAWTHSAIFTFDRITSLIQNVTADSITCAFPAWAPSGDQLAVAGSWFTLWVLTRFLQLHTHYLL